MLTTTSHDSVLLRADDPLIDMNYITSFTGMTDKCKRKANAVCNTCSLQTKLELLLN